MNKAILTVDLGFGDTGKGAIVDFLAREQAAHTVVRYCGGAQAGHRVVVEDADGGVSAEHIFSQFGAGTLAGARTHLSRFMLVEPLAMQSEADHLMALGVADPFGLVTIDEHALITTPFHRAVNRLRELARGSNRHGSCGMGVGETMRDYVDFGRNTLTIGDLRDRDSLHAKLTFMRSINWQKVKALRNTIPASEQANEEWAVFEDEGWIDWLLLAYAKFAAQVEIVSAEFLGTILQDGVTVFEGSQGVLLDEWYGFYPYTTWSTTTLANAYTLLDEVGFSAEIERIGLTRGYMTRHGAGPFVTQNADLTMQLPDACNGFDTWQEGFRVGWLDLVMLRYALSTVGELDCLAVSCLDRLETMSELQICDGYWAEGAWVESLTKPAWPVDLDEMERLGQWLDGVRPNYVKLPSVEALLSQIEQQLGVPIGIVSHGAAANHKRRYEPVPLAI